jgi:hypothetical protein
MGFTCSSRVHRWIWPLPAAIFGVSTGDRKFGAFPPATSSSATFIPSVSASCRRHPRRSAVASDTPTVLLPLRADRSSLKPSFRRPPDRATSSRLPVPTLPEQTRESCSSWAFAAARLEASPGLPGASTRTLYRAASLFYKRESRTFMNFVSPFPTSPSSPPTTTLRAVVRCLFWDFQRSPLRRL